MFLVARFSDCELSCHGLGGHKLLLSASAGQKGVAIVANLWGEEQRGGGCGGEGAGKMKYKGKRQQPSIACTSPSEKKVSLAA